MQIVIIFQGNHGELKKKFKVKKKLKFIPFPNESFLMKGAFFFHCKATSLYIIKKYKQ